MILSATNILGPILGGALFGIMDISYLIFIDVIGAIIAVGSLVFIRFPNPKQEKKAVHIFKEMGEGIREIRKSKLLSILTVYMTIMAILYMPLSALYPLMTNNFFGLEAIHASIVETSFAVGMVLGGLLLAIWGGFKKKQYTIIFSTLLLGLATLFSGLIGKNDFHLFVGLVAIMGFSGTIYSGIYTAIVQMEIRPEVLGRVFSLITSLMLIGTPIGIIFAAPIAEALGVHQCFFMIGVSISIVALITAFLPSMRKEKQP